MAKTIEFITRIIKWGVNYLYVGQAAWIKWTRKWIIKKVFEYKKVKTL